MLRSTDPVPRISPQRKPRKYTGSESKVKEAHVLNRMDP